MSDESISAILFCTTPKGGLLHHSYIFRKPEPLGWKMNNMDFSRLGTMLHLDIQKGKEAMKTYIFQKYIIGTTTCMKHIIMAKKGVDN